MNNAGLPGTGLGGLFYLLLAFWMPLAELPRTLRGQSSRARWRRIGTQFGLAAGIVAALAVTAAAYAAVAGETNLGGVVGVDGSTLVLIPAVSAVLLLSGLVVVLRTWAGWERRRGEE
jgi:hypothetical protein